MINKIKRVLKPKKPPSEYEKLKKSLLASLGAEEDCFCFEFNLGFNGERVVGACAVADGSLWVCNGEDKKSYPLSSLGEICFQNNWGCVSLETEIDGEVTELCRADMKLHHQLREGARRIEAERTKTEKRTPPPPQKCKKCGKPTFNKKEFCPNCAGKKRAFARLIPYAKPHFWLLAVASLCLIAVAAINLVLPVFNKLIVNDYLAADPIPTERSGFIWLIIGMALLGLLSALINALRRYVITIASTKMLVKLREDIYKKIQSLSMTVLNRQSAGELIQRVSNDANEIREFITWLVPELIQQVLTLVAVIIMLFLLNWQLTLIVILPVPFLVIMFRAIHRYTHKRYHRQWHVESDAGTLMHDVFSGMRVVKTYGTEKREEERFATSAYRIAEISKKNELTWNLIMPFASFLLSFGEYAALFFLGCELVGDASFITSGNPNFMLGDLAQFLGYVALVYQPIRWMAFVPRRISRALTSLNKISELLDEESETIVEGKQVESIKGDIEFKNVSFGYNEAENVLKNIDLKINNGEMIGFVGRSGVGKTTAANLILRLYDVTEGSITVDGVDLRELDAHSYRSKIGVVLQETFLFNGTIYSNIAYAKPNATRDEVIRAAKLANAHQFIMKQPDGYNTYVGDRGNTLSGGEKQRIAIARAILRNPRILILDEATSSLDTETEKQIQEAISRLSHGRTTIAIAHRLSTLRNATKIVVFEKGEIEEIGSHDELMRAKGRYYRLVMAQRQVNKMQKD